MKKLKIKISQIFLLAFITLGASSYNIHADTQNDMGKIYIFLESNDKLASQIPVESTGELSLSDNNYDLQKDLHLKHISGTLIIKNGNYKLNAKVNNPQPLGLRSNDGNLEFCKINTQFPKTSNKSTYIKSGLISQLFSKDHYGENNLSIHLNQETKSTPVQYTQILGDVDSTLAFPSVAFTNNHAFSNGLIDSSNLVNPNNYYFNEPYNLGNLPTNTIGQLFEKFNIDLNTVVDLNNKPFVPNKKIGQNGLFNKSIYNHGSVHTRGIKFKHRKDDIKIQEVDVTNGKHIVMGQGKFNFDFFSKKATNLTWIKKPRALANLKISNIQKHISFSAELINNYFKHNPFVKYDAKNKTYLLQVEKHEKVNEIKKEEPKKEEPKKEYKNIISPSKKNVINKSKKHDNNKKVKYHFKMVKNTKVKPTISDSAVKAVRGTS